MRGRNYTKPFSIAGIILGEFLMLYVVFAPYRKGPPVPMQLPLPPEDPLPAHLVEPMGHFIVKLVSCAMAYGLFGALVGLGFGLLVTGLFAKNTQQGL